MQTMRSIAMRLYAMYVTRFKKNFAPKLQTEKMKLLPGDE